MRCHFLSTTSSFRKLSRFSCCVYSRPNCFRSHLFQKYYHGSALQCTEKNIEVSTCKHLFSKSNGDKGLKFNVSYIDEQGKGNSTRKPVVVMIHGAPGSYQDFQPQIDFLLDQGARVISPNFPDLAELLKHRSPKCRNNPWNKASLIRDFLHSLKVHKIDLLVAHSAGAYTAMLLQADKDTLPVHSLALLNPACYQDDVLKPRWLMELLEWLTFNRVGYACMRLFSKPLLKYLFNRTQSADIDGPLLSITSLTSRSQAEAKSMITDTVSSKIPLLYVFSENDKLNSKNSCYKMLEIFGGSRENLWVYDEKGNAKSRGENEGVLRSVCFETGSHYAMRRFPDIVNQELLLLLNKSMRNM